MKLFDQKLPFLKLPMRAWPEDVLRVPEDPVLESDLKRSRFSVRLLRYWWAAQVIRSIAAERSEPLVIADFGCGRGWLRRFVGPFVKAHWIAVDWQPQTEVLKAAGYQDVVHANFDQPLPLAAGKVDIAVALHVFEHLPRPAFSLTEISRCLMDGGIFLGSSPTMPEFLARWRQRSFRRRLASGEISRGGHINSLSPRRWISLAEDCGLQTRLSMGSHLVRWTGSPLENSRLWIRLNQLWAACFPALGSEFCIAASKPLAVDPAAAAWTPQPLTSQVRWGRFTLFTGATASAAAVLLAGLMAVTTESNADAALHEVLSHQMNADAEHFLVVHHHRLDRLNDHPSVTMVKTVEEIDHHLARLPDGTHVLLHEDHLDRSHHTLSDFVIDSRVEVRNEDFYLIRRNGEGTALKHFLSK